MNDQVSDNEFLPEEAPPMSDFLAEESTDSSMSSLEDGSEADAEEDEEEEDFEDGEEDGDSCWSQVRPVGDLSNVVNSIPSPEAEEPGADRCYEMFTDYLQLNELVRSMAHHYSPATDEDSPGELNGRRGSMSSLGSDTGFDLYNEVYSDSPPPFSPSGAHLQDYFTGCEYDRLAGSSRRDLSLAQRRGKIQSGRSFQTQQKLVCVFCRNNGEAESLYASHALKDATGKVTCPILRAYTCPVCKAHGDNAHTLKYCPKNDSPAARQAQAAAACRGRPGGVRRREKVPSVSAISTYYI